MNPAEALPPGWQQSLHHQARALLESLENGHLDEAGILVRQLAASRDRGLYQQVGKLTRELHNAIVHFQLSGPAAQSGSVSSVEGASKRLEYAVELTEQAANRTMDLVEQSAPMAVQLSQASQSLGEDLQRLRKHAMSAREFEGFAARLEDFLATCQRSAQQLSSNLNEILLAQGFQDLTGQLIQRVTALIVNMERDLLQLMLTAARVEHFVGDAHEPLSRLQQQSRQRDSALVKGEGPALEQNTQAQDEVDALLSSLGF